MAFPSRKWLIYFASCLVAMMDFALVLTFGSLFVLLMDRFGENRTTTAIVQSVLLGTTLTSSVLSGVQIKKFFANSILFLDVFIGIMSGVGVSFLFISSTVVAKNSFEEKAQEMAVIAHNVFVGIESIMYPYVFNSLTEIFTVNETFLILGGIFLNNLVISLLLLTNKNEGLVKSASGAISQHTVRTEIEETNDETTAISLRNYQAVVTLWRQIVKILNLRYTLVFLGTGLVMASNSGYLIVFNDVCLWKGFTKDESLRLFIVFHTSSAVGRALPLIFSKLSKQGACMMFLLALFAASGCIGQLFVLFATTVGVAIAGNMFAGLTQGGVICAGTVAIANISSPELFGVAFGLLYTLIGILILSIGPIYGYIRDSIQSYEIAIILTTALNGIGVSLFTTGAIYIFYQERSSKGQTTKTNLAPADKMIKMSDVSHTNEIVIE